MEYIPEPWEITGNQPNKFFIGNKYNSHEISIKTTGYLTGVAVARKTAERICLLINMFSGISEEEIHNKKDEILKILHQ